MPNLTMPLLRTYKKYLKASSLIESTMAIAIISFCLLIGMRVFGIVTDNKPIIDYDLISIHINQLIDNVRTTKNYENEVFQFEGLEIEKTVSNYENIEKLKQIIFKVKTAKDTLIIKSLILNYD